MTPPPPPLVGEPSVKSCRRRGKIERKGKKGKEEKGERGKKKREKGKGKGKKKREREREKEREGHRERKGGAGGGGGGEGRGVIQEGIRSGSQGCDVGANVNIFRRYKLTHQNEICTDKI